MNSLLLSGLIFVPILLAVLAWVTKGKVQSSIVGLSALATAVLGLVVTARESFTLTLPIEMGMVSGLLEMLVILVVLFLGIRIRSVVIALLAIVQLGFSVMGEFEAEDLAHSVTFNVDSLARILVLITTVIGGLIVFYAIGYMKEHEHHAPVTAASNGQFFFFLIGFLGAMNGLVMANDLRWLSIFWELTTICSFMLIGHDGTPEARTNAKRALLLNSFGGSALIIGSFVATISGVDGLHGIHMQMNALAPHMASLCFALFVVAGFTKSAQMPFQSWLLGAMVAPTPVSALLHSATMVNAGVYVILRLGPSFSGTTMAYFTALAGAATFAITSALAIGQSNGKKVLAYSTIANLGLIVVCAGIGTPLAYAAALMILCFHAASKGLLFLCMGTIEQKIGSRDIEDMGNLSREMPFTTVLTVIGMLSMLFPPFGMLLSKWMAIESSVGALSVLLLLVAGSAFTVTFWAKWIGRITTVSYHPSYSMEQLPRSKVYPLFLLALLVIVAGLATLPVLKEIITPIAVTTFSDAAIPGKPDFALLFSAGRFVAWPFVIFPVVVVLISIGSFLRVKESQVRAPFLCGENIDGSKKTYAFRSAMDKPEHAWMPSVYLKSVFDEARLTLWANPLAWAIIAALFIRSIP